jgi:hypothetical protein
MTIIDNVWLIIGVVNFILIIVAVIVIVYNKKMTTTGRVLRILEIIILPLLGPIFTLIEVLHWRVKDEKTKSKSSNI